MKKPTKPEGMVCGRDKRIKQFVARLGKTHAGFGDTKEEAIEDLWNSIPICQWCGEYVIDEEDEHKECTLLNTDYGPDGR